MTLVRMAVIAYGKAKLVPGYIKLVSTEWDGPDLIEAHSTSDGRIHIDIYHDKLVGDQARRDLPQLEKELHYNNNQASKIEKELKEGRIGRAADKDKFETEANRLTKEIRAKKELIESSQVTSYRFDIEDCF